MNNEELLSYLRSQPRESEWLEFKENYYHPERIGEYISALSNSACLHGKPFGYLVFGIEDNTHNIKGTSLDFYSIKKGNERLEVWISKMLSPRIDFSIKQFTINALSVVVIEIQAAMNIPIKFMNKAYIRIGEDTRELKNYPEKERQIWIKKPASYDWSAETSLTASIKDIDPEAIAKARAEYKKKHTHDVFFSEIDEWDDHVFYTRFT